MKCIQMNKTKTDPLGEIVRVPDDVAEETVSKGHAVYVPKKLWKEKVRDAQVDS